MLALAGSSFTALPAALWAQAPQTMPAGGAITPAALADQALCASAAAYPKRTPWQGPPRFVPPVSATSGTPRIEQYRNGTLIAVYSSFANQPGCVYQGGGADLRDPGPAAASGCGPFTRTHAYRLAAAGDRFLVYPAVYSGEFNQPWIGPMWDSDAEYAAGISHPPDNITISGVVQNGLRPEIRLVGGVSSNTLGQAPVYIAAGSAIAIDNINITADQGSRAGRSGIYIDAARDLSLADMRVSFFQRARANGIFVTPGASGTLTMTRLEIDHDGAANGPAHGAYLNGSANDPNFTVVITNTYFHDGYAGHLLKSRAQTTIINASYFQGGLPQGRNPQAESYLVDIANGGRFSLRNSLLSKTASGAESNALMVSYGEEGIPNTRPSAIDIENNDFLALSATTDGSHWLTPLGFLAPRVIPGAAGWPAGISAHVLKNVFTGFCQSPYLGDYALQAGFADLTQRFTLVPRFVSDEAALAQTLPGYGPVIGTASYLHRAAGGAPRAEATIGAMD